MRDYYMGAEVEIEEMSLGHAAPEVTPPQGVILTELGRDGWLRKYHYKSRVDVLGNRRESKLLVSEIPGDASPQMGRDNSGDQAVPFSRPARIGGAPMNGLGAVPLTTAPFGGPQIQVPSPSMGDSRITMPAHMAVRIVQQTPYLGQVATAAPQTPPDPAVSSSAPLPLANGTDPSQAQAAPPDATAPPQEPPGAAPAAPAPSPNLPALPACATAPMQLADGTILNPDDAITLKALCEMIPYLEKLFQQSAPPAQNGPMRPGGPIPLSIGGVPSFGPAGGPFAQGGFGGAGGGGGSPGFGPIGVVSGATPTGGNGMNGGPGPAGPAGPQGIPGVGNIIDGILKNDTSFTAAGALTVVPGTTFTINVLVAGNVWIAFSGTLAAEFPQAEVFGVAAGLAIDGTNYTLYSFAENIGSGGDGATGAPCGGGILLPNVPVGAHTISMIYVSNLNRWDLVASPAQPVSVVAIHS